jgi:hypothetical protein
MEKKGSPSGVMNHHRPFRLRKVKNVLSRGALLFCQASEVQPEPIIDEMRVPAAMPDVFNIN